MAGDTNLPAGVTLVDGFPFDSSPNLVFTDQGYPRGDRSVDAWVMQRVFKQFFSNGVFGTPANALQINKGTSGLTVTIQPGMFIIDGAMGGVKASDGPLTLTLDTGAAQGNVCYGVMLRYDNNPNMRGLGFRVVKGTAGANPQPPAPDTTSENVHELRLGYVTVPNGATDLTNATVHNEKGLDVCPYAAPFDEIDVDAVVHDAQVNATEILAKFKGDVQVSLDNVLNFIAKNMELINAALNDTAVGYLQSQIDELKKAGFNESVLNKKYLAFEKPSPDQNALLGLVGGSVGTRELQYASVTHDKLALGSVTLANIAADSIDVTGGIASANANWRNTNDILQLAYDFHSAQLNDDNFDTIVKWVFDSDADLNSGKWDASGKYYYADKGSA